MKKQMMKTLGVLGLAIGYSSGTLGNTAFWVDGSENIYNFPDHVVSLTFDDGPDLHSNELYTYLKQQKIAATFFTVGDVTRNPSGIKVGAANYPSYLPLLKSNNQIFGNHTYSHNYGAQIGDADILQQINNLQALIDPYINNHWYFLRAPYNNPNIATYNSMPGITRQYRDIETNYDSSDWSYAQDGLTAQKAMDDLIAKIEEKGNHGGIIQMHDANELSPGTTYTLDAIKYLVPILKQKGFVFAGPVLEFSPKDLFTAYNGDFSDADGFGNDSSYFV